MMNKGARRCFNCKYFFVPPLQQVAECRFEPPQVFIVGMTPQGPTTQSRFRNVLPDWWCGQWTAGIIEASDLQELPPLRPQ